MSFAFISRDPGRHPGVLDGSVRAHYKATGGERRQISPTSHKYTDLRYRLRTTRYNFFTTYSDIFSFPLLENTFQDFETTVNRFLTGRASADDFERSIRNIFQLIFDINIYKGVITSDDHEAKARIIEVDYLFLRARLMNEVHRTHHQEGRNIAIQHGFRAGDPNHKSISGAFYDWLYYNSDFYFLELEMVSILKNVTNELLNKNGYMDTDLEFLWHYDNAGGPLNFHQKWHQWSDSQLRFAPDRAIKNTSIRGWMIDVRTSPPRGFSFFFGESSSTKEVRDPNTNQMTTLTFFKRVMIFNKQLLTREGEFTEDKFNLLDFWVGNRTGNNPMQRFLGNFEIFRNASGPIHKPCPYEKMLLFLNDSN